MKWVFLFCLVSYACASSEGQQTYLLEDAEVLFEKFIVDYDKKYADEHEKQMRFEIFKQSLMKVNALNKKQGGSQVFGITKLSDYTAEESRHLRGFRATDDSFCKDIKTDSDIPDIRAPNALDWRDQNVVSMVFDQGPCMAGYAFSAVGNIEGQYYQKNKKIGPLSPQQIIDCSRGKYGNNGCEGGSISGSFLYLMGEKYGINYIYDYPYAYKESGKCSKLLDMMVAKVASCNNYNLTSQLKLKQLLYTRGPIPVAVDSSDFTHYSKHVIKNCSAKNLDHAMLLVGYGTDPVDGDYWLLKNSWGTNVGEGGYYRIERGENKSSCGILNPHMAIAILE